jgi:predicted PurR-regulated permease PerM
MTLLDRSQVWAWIAIAAAVGFLIWLLKPILFPFLAAGILAYILDPLVERMTRRGLNRTASVVFVMLLLLALLVAFLLVVLPLAYKETRLLMDKLPGLLDWLNMQAAPWLKARLDIDLAFDVETVKQMARDAFSQNEDLAKGLLRSIGVGGLALIGFLANLLLLPVVLFFLLRDWNKLVATVARLIPRRVYGKAVAITREIDAVLAEWLRGQLTVVLIMGTYYSIALWVARLEFALPIGILMGLAVIVPYVGVVIGLFLATAAALLQFGTFAGVLWVWLAIGLGQALEGMALTPLIVGERIGLHPVAVIFALLAFGQVFGFFGVLLALPASAVLLVALRHLRGAYEASPLYGNQ